MIRNQQAYLAAIALNNAGVMLLRRQMLHEAVATMQDALRLIRYSIPAANSDDGNDLPISFDEEAQQACWSRTCVTMMPGNQINPSPFGKEIMIVTDQDNPSIVYEALRNSPTAFCVIKIDPLECLSQSENILDRLEIEASILLYNYGIASICFAELTVAYAEDIRQNSVTILKLAQFGATKLLNDALSSPINPMNIPSSLLLVVMLLLDTLCQTCGGREIHGWPCLARPFTDDLHLLLALVKEREIVLLKEGLGLKSGASPAA